MKRKIGIALLLVTLAIIFIANVVTIGFWVTILSLVGGLAWMYLIMWLLTN